MNVKNCRGCRRLFNYISGPYLCPACREKMEEKFQAVKEYIRENPGIGVQQVAEACDVETTQINQWLREDRLELTEGSPLMLGCESCGQLIRSGKYCDACKYNMANGFKRVMNGQKSEETPMKRKQGDGNRMRYLER